MVAERRVPSTTADSYIYLYICEARKKGRRPSAGASAARLHQGLTLLSFVKPCWSTSVCAGFALVVIPALVSLCSPPTSPRAVGLLCCGQQKAGGRGDEGMATAKRIPTGYSEGGHFPVASHLVASFDDSPRSFRAAAPARARASPLCSFSGSTAAPGGVIVELTGAVPCSMRTFVQ